MEKAFIKAIYILVFLTSTLPYAAINQPFPLGQSMANFGTLNGGLHNAHDPFSSASLLFDSSYGISLSAIKYFDNMDNGSTADLWQAGAGVWIAHRWFISKISITEMRAMGIYFDQSAHLSLGYRLSWLSFSIDLNGNRIGLKGLSEQNHLLGTAGFSAMLRFNYAAISADGSATINHELDIDNPLSSLVRFGIYSKENRFGLQGVLITIKPEAQEPISFAIGEEYRFNNIVAFQASLANNPVKIGFGVAISVKKTASSFALVNHPVLGWSQGIALDYFQKSAFH